MDVDAHDVADLAPVPPLVHRHHAVVEELVGPGHGGARCLLSAPGPGGGQSRSVNQNTLTSQLVVK